MCLECKETRHQWSGPEANAGTRLRDRCLDGWTVAMETDANLTDELQERKVLSNARSRGPGATPFTLHRG